MQVCAALSSHRDGVRGLTVGQFGGGRGGSSMAVVVGRRWWMVAVWVFVSGRGAVLRGLLRFVRLVPWDRPVLKLGLDHETGKLCQPRPRRLRNRPWGWKGGPGGGRREAAPSAVAWLPRRSCGLGRRRARGRCSDAGRCRSCRSRWSMRHSRRCRCSRRRRRRGPGSVCPR